MLLSIDVGIKNLAYCLFKTPEKILDWNVINLCDKQQPIAVCSQPTCKFKSKFKSKSIGDSVEIFYCLRHAKKSKMIIPSRSTSKVVINAMHKSELQEFVSSRHIISPTTLPYMSKPELTETVNTFILNNSLLLCEQCESSKNISLIDIGISMKGQFDIIFSKHIDGISTIIIENQISPIAGRLKTIQGMIAQYFIMLGKTDIRFVSASNKLKGYDINTTISDDYNMRKNNSVRITEDLINSKFPEWITMFKTHRKLDDLSDAFLQGVWFNSKISQ